MSSGLATLPQGAICGYLTTFGRWTSPCRPGGGRGCGNGTTEGSGEGGLQGPHLPIRQCVGACDRRPSKAYLAGSQLLVRCLVSHSGVCCSEGGCDQWLMAT